MKSQFKFWTTIALALAIAVGYFFLGFRPFQKSAEAMRAGIAQTEGEINEANQRIRLIPDTRKQRDASKVRLNKLKGLILPPDSISQAMSRLNRLAKQYQVRLTKINFSTDSLLVRSRTAASAQAASFELPILMEFEGYFLDFGTLMDHLHRLPFAIGFTDFSILTQEKSEKLKFFVRAWIRVDVQKNNSLGRI